MTPPGPSPSLGISLGFEVVIERSLWAAGRQRLLSKSQLASGQGTALSALCPSVQLGDMYILVHSLKSF